MEELIGSTVAGCRIEEKIGEGGMGSVYKAHHLALDIPVAVKILRPVAAIPNAQERFLREARIAARLRHPNIVGVLNVGQEQGRYFIIMEYVEGESLQAIMKRLGKLNPDEAAAIAIAVLEALHTAFGHNIIHRDVKPENILIDTNGVVKLADLGLARRADDVNLTQSNTMLGSPLYIAPEQAEDPSRADCRSDIYSLGCTLYHMVSGNAPFTGNTVIEVVMQHVNKPVPLLTDAFPGVSPGLSAIVARMMEKDPSRRFQTPREAIAALKGYLQKQQVKAPAPKKAFSVRAWRNAAVAAFVATAAIIGAAAAVLRLAVKKTPRVRPDAVATANAPVQPLTHDTTLTPPPQPPEKPPYARKHPSVKKQQPKPSSPFPEKRPSRPVAVRNPVLAAVKIGDNIELKRLLEAGTSPNPASGSGSTPLHEAVRQGSTEAVELLLKFGANPNVRDQHGDTPLHYALREGASFMTEILLKYGANPNMSDHLGKTPLAIARSVDSGLEQMLRKYGGK